MKMTKKFFEKNFWTKDSLVSKVKKEKWLKV